MFDKRILLAAPTALLLSGTSVLALTADEVWADLQSFATSNDTLITAATEVKGDGMITLNGVRIGPPSNPQAITIAEMSIEEQDDGSVAFFPTDIKLAGADGVNMSVDQKELSVSVFEDEGGLGYSVFADLLKISFDSQQKVAEAEVKDSGNFSFEGLEATYGRALDSASVDLKAKRLAYDVTQIDPSASTNSVVTSDSSDLSIEGSLVLPDGVDLAKLDAPGAFEDAVAKGLAVQGAMTSGPSKGTMSESAGPVPLQVSFEGSGSTMSVQADKTMMRIEATTPGMKMEITPAGMPAPLPVSLDDMSMTYHMPVSAPDGGDYELKLKLSNLVLADGIWAMFDPTAALPHDPANLTLDLSGQAKFDALAMMAAERTGAAPPIPEPLSLNITDLLVKAAGAALTGNGAFTFDNAMLAQGGPPMPIGKANLRLEGGNKLIDGLIAAGLLKQEDAMGARMMMAMFGKPEGEDVLTSEIEAKQGGSIFVNGQQIQ